MNKIELNKYIESISSQIPLIHSFYTDDVYEAWNTDEVRYGSLSFCITSSSVNDSTTTWNATVYYADRLLEDKSNRDAIQTDSINIITSIMNAVAMDEDIVSINYPTQVELFEQKFVDYLAGGYATMQIETQNSVSKCGYGFIKEEEGCEGAINELESEIRDLNNVISEKDETISNLETQLDEFGTLCESQKQQIIIEKDEVIAEKDNEISDLNTTIDELRKGGIDFGVIGYDKEESSKANEYFNANLRRSEELLEHLKSHDSNSHISYNTIGYKDIVYAPMHTFREFKNEVKIDSLFSDCTLLRYVPLYDTSTTKNMQYLFGGCKSLVTIPPLDTSNVTTMRNMLSNCESLVTIPLLDTSNVTDMYYMFFGCASLTTIPQLNTSNVTTMYNMFYGCKSLVTIPPLDTSNVTTMYNMFYDCESLVTIPPLDTSKVNDLTSMFSGCKSLVSLPVIDFSGYDRTKINNFGSFFGYSNITTLTDLGGFKNFAQNWTSYGLSYLPNLTKQSLLNVLNYLDDVNDLGGRKLQLGTSHLAKLTDEEKMIATTKGWTLI